MGEIRIVGPGKTCGYPYPVCKKNPFFTSGLVHPYQLDESVPVVKVFSECFYF